MTKNSFILYLSVVLNYVGILSIFVFTYKFLAAINVYGKGLAFGIVLYLVASLLRKYVIRSIMSNAIDKLKKEKT